MARDIGLLTLDWNALQENILMSFCFLLTGQIGGRASAVWHSTPNDRAQREMLRALISSPSVRAKLSEDTYKEMVWLINEANKLAEQRNSVVHAPFIAITEGDETSLQPHYFLNNPRANQLRDKSDYRSEINWYQAKAMTLAKFAYAMYWHISKGQPLPERPSLPHRGQRQTHN